MCLICEDEQKKGLRSAARAKLLKPAPLAGFSKTTSTFGQVLNVVYLSSSGGVHHTLVRVHISPHPCRKAGRVHSGFRRGAGSDAAQMEVIQHRQRAAVERGGERGAAGVGDLGVVEV